MKSVLSFFRRNLAPSRNFIFTPVTIYLNAVAYIVVSLIDNNFWLPTGPTVIALGGNIGYLTLDGQWWRLITCVFLHFGLLHMASNMYAFWQIGKILEDFIGTLRLGAAYIFCGISASLCSTWWHSDTLFSVSAGASGAIFGMFGLFLALVTTELVRKEARWDLFKSMGISILVNLAISYQFHFDNAAHIGGLLTGIFSGYAIYFLYKFKLDRTRKIFPVMMIVLSAGGIVFALPQIPKTSVDLMKGLTEIDLKIMGIKNDFDRLSVQGKQKLADSLYFNSEWDKVSLLAKELEKRSSDEKLNELMHNLQKETPLRKQETQLLLRINKGDTALVPQLQRVQEKIAKLTGDSL